MKYFLSITTIAFVLLILFVPIFVHLENEHVFIGAMPWTSWGGSLCYALSNPVILLISGLVFTLASIAAAVQMLMAMEGLRLTVALIALILISGILFTINFLTSAGYAWR
jgi:hypothetical protein